MYYSVVKEILTRYYGKPRQSLAIGSPEAADLKNYIVFCTLSKETEDRAAGLMSDIAPNHTATFTQKLLPRDGIDGKTPECVFFESDESGHWELSLYRCVSIVYRPTRGRKMAAEIQRSRFPAVTLTDRAPLIGLCAENGFSYWVNKELYLNSRFKGIAVDLLTQVGSSDNPFAPLIAKAISCHECFLPTVPCDELKDCKCPEDMIRLLHLPDVPNADYDSTDLNTGYLIAYLSTFVEPDDWRVLTDLPPAAVSRPISLEILYKRDPKPFLCAILNDRFIDSRDYDLLDLIDDYVDQSLKDGQKIRLGLNRRSFLESYRTLAKKAGWLCDPLPAESKPRNKGNNDSGEFYQLSIEDCPF